MRKLVAVFIETLWLVLGGCGSVVLAEGYSELGIDFVSVAIAFGLTLVTMAYAISHISGYRLNPAVSIGLSIGGWFDLKEFLPYIVSQVLEGIAGAGILFLIVSRKLGFEIGGFAANGYRSHSLDGYGLSSSLTIEIVITFIFLIIILGATHKQRLRIFKD